MARRGGRAAWGRRCSSSKARARWCTRLLRRDDGPSPRQCPHALVLCHRAGAEVVEGYPDHPLPPLAELVELHERASLPLRPAGWLESRSTHTASARRTHARPPPLPEPKLDSPQTIRFASAVTTCSTPSYASCNPAGEGHRVDVAVHTRSRARSPCSSPLPSRGRSSSSARPTTGRRARPSRPSASTTRWPRSD